MRGKVHVYVSKFSVKNESDGRYTIRDILMFWHDILRRTVQERKPSAWWIIHIMKQKKIKRLRPISDNFQTLLMVRKRDFTIRNSQNKLKQKKKRQTKHGRSVRLRYYLVHLMTSPFIFILVIYGV